MNSQWLLEQEAAKHVMRAEESGKIFLHFT